ncbi:MAG: class I SAM-dependent methyltransferase [Asticcacaulis sp.]
MTDNQARDLRDRHANLWSQQLKTNVLRYPETAIVAWLARSFPDRQANRNRAALDIGFGSGRNFALLADFGFDIHGLEISETAIAEGEAVLGGLGLTGHLNHCALEEHGYEAGAFTALIFWGGVFLAPLPVMKENLRRCYDLLASGGRMILNFRTPDNWFHGLGREVVPYGYELDERAGPYAGNTYIFLPEAVSRSLLTDAGFVVDNMERLDNWKANGTQQHSWHIYWVRKP